MSEINKLTVNGKVYDLADATAREQMHHLRRAGQLIAPVITLTDYLENPNKMANQEGTLVATGSPVSVSELFFCYPGDTVSGKLSNRPDGAVFITYDKNGDVVTYIPGVTYATMTEFSHTFTAGECTFRIGGAQERQAQYALSYQPKNNLAVCFASENDTWEA